MSSSTNRATVQTRPSKCAHHGTVDGTRRSPRILFPFIITGVLRLIAMTRPFLCPYCNAATTKA